MKPSTESNRTLLLIPIALTCLVLTCVATQPEIKPTSTKVATIDPESPSESQIDIKPIKTKMPKATETIVKTDEYDESKFVYKPSIPEPVTLLRLICDQGDHSVEFNSGCGSVAINILKETNETAQLVQALSNYVADRTGKTSSQIMQTALINFQAEDRESQLLEAKKKYKDYANKTTNKVEAKVPQLDRDTFVNIICTLEGMSMENIRICQDSAESMQRNIGKDRATILTAINFAAVVTGDSPTIVEEKAKASWAKSLKSYAENTCPKDGTACD